MLTTARFAAFIATIILGFSISSFAQIGSMPEALFGAQSLSLGRSAVITPHDALAVSWNPAGITTLQRVTVSVASGSLPTVNASHTSLGFVIPTRRFGHFGVSFFQLRIGFTQRDDTGQEVGEDTITDRHLLFTYGKNFSEVLALGVNVKFVDQNWAGQAVTVENPNLDAGLSYRFHSEQFLLQNLSVGIAIDNLVQPVLKYAHASEKLPLETRIIAEKMIALGKNKVTLVSNVGLSESAFNRKTKFYGGVEYSHQSTIALRAGVYDENFSIGTGLQFKGARLDYARTNWQMAPENSSSATDAVTLTYQF